MKCFSIEPLTNWYCSCVHCAPDERKKKQKTHFFESPTNFFLSLWENPCIIPIRGIKWRLKQMSCLAICIVWSYCVCADACTQSIHSFESYYFFLFFSLWNCCRIFPLSISYFFFFKNFHRIVWAGTKVTHHNPNWKYEITLNLIWAHLEKKNSQCDKI